jgi:hypothetical protein
MPEDFKTCPYCKGQIRVSAVKCRYCGEWLEAQPGTSPTESSEQIRAGDFHTEQASSLTEEERVASEAPASIQKNDPFDDSAPFGQTATRTAPPAAQVVTERENYMFAYLYAVGCFIGTLAAIYFLFSGVTAQQYGYVIAAPTWPKQIVLLLQAILWAATGVCIMLKRKLALPLVYVGVVTSGLGVLMRGIVPLDLLLYLPTIAIVFYLRKRRSMLK